MISRRFFLTRAMAAAVLLSGCGGQTAGQYIDDSTITAKVKSKLFDDPKTSGFSIKVETYHGVVQLSGFVDSQAEAYRAEKLARGVAGVKKVRNDVIVKPGR